MVRKDTVKMVVSGIIPMIEARLLLSSPLELAVRRRFQQVVVLMMGSR